MTMRLLTVLAAMLLVVPTFAEDGYSTATIVDAGQNSELDVGVFGGLRKSNENSITVELNGVRLTADYETFFASGKNASSNFIVGSQVQARVHRNKWLYVLREDGKPVKARISRRELVD